MTVFAAVDAAAALRPCCERYRGGHAAVDIHKDMFGEVWDGVGVGVLWDCWGEWGGG